MGKADKVSGELVAAPVAYMENYKVLADAAHELREQDVVDIDKLVPIVDRALAAYAACKSRIDAVEALLSERLGGAEE